MVLAIIAVLSCFSPTPQESFDLLTVQEGYSKQLIACEPQVMDPVSFCFDEHGNILVAESFRQENAVPDNRSSSFWLEDDLQSQTVQDRLAMFEYWADQRENGMEFYSQFEERVRRLEDRDGDGVFETSTIVADGFNDPLDGTGAGLLVIDGDIWFTSIPTLWRLRDTNGDGHAETRDEIFTGFGVRVALRGHDLHGLALGIDGRLYWSLGDRGYHLELDDGRELHSPGEGAVFRCELDGTNLDVYHHGLRNPQELAFDTYGNLFTGDNNSDAGDKARLVYCVEGGETGWRMEYQTLEGENKRGPWLQENGWDPHADSRPAWILPAIDTIGAGPSGLVAYPGGGLSERYDDHFFMCDFRGEASYSNVLSFAVEPSGASFTKVDEHPFVQHVLCTDVDFGYNGKMVVSDWGEGWQGNFEGRLYSVWDEQHVHEGDVSELFAEGFTSQPNDSLQAMLAHRDRRVRIRAQIELAKRNDATPFVHAMASSHQLARIHGMWGLAMLDRQGNSQMDQIVPLLYDSDAEIRAQASKILGESQYRLAFDEVVKLIDDASLRVSYFATIAAGHLGNPYKAVIEMLKRNNDQDVYLRHAGVVALANSQYPSGLVNLHDHPSKSVRLSAVLALRKLQSPFLSDFLEDEHLEVATEAARAIHDVPIQKSMHTLATSLQEAEGLPWQRRALSASQRLGSEENLAAVIAFAADTTKSERLRLIALDIIKTWNDPPPREIIDGRWRPVLGADTRSVALIHESIDDLVASTSGELLVQVFKIAQHYQLDLPQELNRRLLVDESQPMELRVHCLYSLSDEAAIDFAKNNDAWQLRAAALDVLLETNTSQAIKLLLQSVESDELFEAQAAIQSLSKEEAGFSQIDSDSLPVELQLDYAIANGTPLMFGETQEGQWLIEGGDATRGKFVVFENSRSECLRCHKVNDHGGIAGPHLDGVGDRLTDIQLRDSLLVPSKDIPEGFGESSAMPPMGVLLDYSQLRDVIAYLKSLKNSQ